MAVNPLMLALGGLKGAKPDTSGMMDSASDGQRKLSPATVVYMGPEDGPFQCSNCEYFQQPNACYFVDGVIQPEGCCDLFTTSDNDGDEGGPDTDSDNGMAAPAPAAPKANPFASNQSKILS